MKGQKDSKSKVTFFRAEDIFAKTNMLISDNVVKLVINLFNTKGKILSLIKGLLVVTSY